MKYYGRGKAMWPVQLPGHVEAGGPNPYFYLISDYIFMFCHKQPVVLIPESS